MNIFIVFLCLSYFTTTIGLRPLFIIYGVQGWKAFVPILNYLIILKIIHRPWWWFLLFLIPTISILIWWITLYQLYDCYGRKNTSEKLIGCLLWFIYIPYLGFNKKTNYDNPINTTKKSKSKISEWVDAGLFAIIAATVIRTFFIEAFTIPTSSLEKSLMVGDYLFVSKVSYGAKIPNTPLSFPFTHHTLFLTKDTKSYLEWINLPYLRLPGLGKVKNNDYVVFNYPDGDTVALGAQNQSYYQLCREFSWKYVNEPDNINPYSGEPFGKIVSRPPDKRENYVKRCVAIPGDTLIIKHSLFYINGQKNYIAPTMQHKYIVKTTDEFGFSQKLLDKFDITESIDNRSIPGSLIIYLPNDKVEAFKQLPNVSSVIPLIADSGVYDPRIFPHNSEYTWNVDNFGPLVMPKKGMTISLDTSSIKLYDRIITAYEGNSLKINGNKIFINNIQTKQYTFKMDYYFMCGDNRHNSADSRCWGFVPEDHIVGKPVFIWMSWKNGFMVHPRWNRFFTFVYDDGLSRSFFIPFVISLLIIWSFNYYRKTKTNRVKN